MSPWLARNRWLRPMTRHHGHLSPDVETAGQVGARGGAPSSPRIDEAAMGCVGHVFLRTPNGGWLTSLVPLAFITVVGDACGDCS